MYSYFDNGAKENGRGQLTRELVLPQDNRNQGYGLKVSGEAQGKNTDNVVN